MHDVWITGVGMLSCLGEGNEVHLNALREGQTRKFQAPVNIGRFADYPVHALGEVSFDTQIQKKSDQRQMEPWQRIGVHAAGLALDHAGLKGDAERLSQLHLIVAAGGGERDQAVDTALLTDMAKSDEPLVLLNERLMSDLRPTLFLAQLSNLLAGNISIVHGVTGASRTFMGEEQSGVDALRTAQARIASGQADAILVGGSFNAERDDVIMQYALSGALYRGKTPAPVRERCASEDGFVFGSGGAFILLESPDHARARHVKPLASLNTVYVGRARRHASENTVRPDLPDTLHALLNDVQTSNPDLILTNATGIAHLWDAEHNALKNAFPNTPVVATGDLIGHTLEPQSIFGVALAALHIQSSQASRILISSVGHQRGEGVMMVEKV